MTLLVSWLLLAAITIAIVVKRQEEVQAACNLTPCYTSIGTNEFLCGSDHWYVTSCDAYCCETGSCEGGTYSYCTSADVSSSSCGSVC